LQKDYEFAERGEDLMKKIGANSPERNARPIKRVNPYDCFRSGETRQSIIECVQKVEKIAQKEQEQLKKSAEGRSSLPIQPYRKYGPAKEQRLQHAVPNSDPDQSFETPSTPPRLSKQDTATFGSKLARSASTLTRTWQFGK